MEKSPDAFKTISEVAEELNLPQHVLRFWETRFINIKPMKRGGGRRYYRPLDVDLIKTIRHMLYEQGYTIKGVQKLLKEKGSQFISTIKHNEPHTKNTIEQNKKDDFEYEKITFEDKIDQSLSINMQADIRHHQKSKTLEEHKSLSNEKRVLLERVLIDLLECKRLLDQVR